MAEHGLDDLDRRILEELVVDARLTQVALAARVGRSRSAVQERIRRLEQAGIIQGYTLRLGRARESGMRAYLLVKGTGPSHDRAVKQLAAIHEVKVADSVSGSTDLILQLEAPGLEDLNRVRDAIARLPGVGGTETLLVLAPRFDRR